MLHQPVRLGGLALACALATSTLVLVAFLASSLVLSVVGGLGGLGSTRGSTDGDAAPPATAVLLSAERHTDEECDRRRDGDRGRRAAERDRLRDADRCAERRTEDGAGRP